MGESERMKDLENRVAELHWQLDQERKETNKYKNLWDQVDYRISNLEWIKARIQEEPTKIPTGRMVTISITVNDEIFSQAKNAGVLVQVLLKNAMGHVQKELETALISGELRGWKVPMLERAKWLSDK